MEVRSKLSHPTLPLKIIQGSKFQFQNAYEKSGAAQAAPAIPIPTAMIFL